MHDKINRNQGYNIVAFGGGTGLSTLLAGMQDFYPRLVQNITAVVAVSDNGGSTGRIRKEYNLPAPGDIRKSIIALAKNQDLITDLFAYRFNNSESELYKHSMGNLILTALSDISGSFAKAVYLASRMLNTIGIVLPVTEDSVQLVAKFNTGVIVRGEVEIYQYGKTQKGRIVELWLEPVHLDQKSSDNHRLISKIKVNKKVLNAVKNADLIILGPGSLYTSVIASFLLPDIQNALADTKAKIVYVVNIFSDYGESRGYKASDHIKVINNFLKHRNVDMVVINNGTIPKEVVNRYKKTEGSVPVVVDIAECKNLANVLIVDDFVEIFKVQESFRNTTHIVKKVRHNARKVVKKILEDS